MSSNTYRVFTKCEGLKDIIIPEHDPFFIDHNVTYPLFLNDFCNVDECLGGHKYEGRIYTHHGQFEIDHIEIHDSKGHKIDLSDCVIEEKDRSHKDLYWYYNRNENYWMDISFTMPNHDVYIKAYYVLSPNASVLAVDISAIEHLLDKEHPSYLYCLEETYNGSHHYFLENDVYHYMVLDVMTFGIFLKEAANILMEVDGKIYHPVSVDEDQHLYIFGSLDENDGWDDVINPLSEKIALKNGYCLVRFFIA